MIIGPLAMVYFLVSPVLNASSNTASTGWTPTLGLTRCPFGLITERKDRCHVPAHHQFKSSGRSMPSHSDLASYPPPGVGPDAHALNQVKFHKTAPTPEGEPAA